MKVLMDEIVFDANGNQIDFRPEDEKTTKFWNGANVQTNIARRMYAYLYQNNRLSGIAEYVTEHIDEKDNAKVINIVIDYDKLTPEFINEMEERFPNNGLKNVANWGVCRYSGTTGLVNFAYKSYRDWYGTIGSSFEHPYVQGFLPKTINEFRRIQDEQGTVASAIAVIHTVWNEDGKCVIQTAEEYENECRAFEMAMEV